MPMIDVYAEPGTSSDPHRLARQLAATLMEVEGVPPIALFKENTAACVHETNVANVNGDTNYVRVQVPTLARLTVTSSSLRSAASPTWSPRQRTIRPWPSAPGCFSRRLTTVVGASLATPTPTRNSSPPRARRSPRCRPETAISRYGGR